MGDALYRGYVHLLKKGLRQRWKRVYCVAYERSVQGVARIEIYRSEDDFWKSKNGQHVILQNVVYIKETMAELTDHKVNCTFVLKTESHELHFGVLSTLVLQQWVAAISKAAFAPSSSTGWNDHCSTMPRRSSPLGSGRSSLDVDYEEPWDAQDSRVEVVENLVTKQVGLFGHYDMNISEKGILLKIGRSTSHGWEMFEICRAGTATAAFFFQTRNGDEFEFRCSNPDRLLCKLRSLLPLSREIMTSDLLAKVHANLDNFYPAVFKVLQNAYREPQTVSLSSIPSAGGTDTSSDVFHSPVSPPSTGQSFVTAPQSGSVTASGGGYCTATGSPSVPIGHSQGADRDWTAQHAFSLPPGVSLDGDSLSQSAMSRDPGSGDGQQRYGYHRQTSFTRYKASHLRELPEGFQHKSPAQPEYLTASQIHLHSNEDEEHLSKSAKRLTRLFRRNSKKNLSMEENHPEPHHSQDHDVSSISIPETGSSLKSQKHWFWRGLLRTSGKKDRNRQSQDPSEAWEYAQKDFDIGPDGHEHDNDTLGREPKTRVGLSHARALPPLPTQGAGSEIADYTTRVRDELESTQSRPIPQTSSASTLHDSQSALSGPPEQADPVILRGEPNSAATSDVYAVVCKPKPAPMAQRYAEQGELMSRIRDLAPPDPGRKPVPPPKPKTPPFSGPTKTTQSSSPQPHPIHPVAAPRVSLRQKKRSASSTGGNGENDFPDNAGSRFSSVTYRMMINGSSTQPQRVSSQEGVKSFGNASRRVHPKKNGPRPNSTVSISTDV